MKRGFIRAIWGNFTGNTDLTSPKPSKLESDILKQVKCDLCDYHVYVFGDTNKEFIKKFGIENRMVSDKSNLWDMKTELYRHKLEVIKCAMEDFDEIVYLDWDCVPQKQVDDSVWDILSKKEVVQANLQLYKTKKCLWRQTDHRKTCNGGFIYIRNKNIPNLLIKNWESFKKYVEEQKEKRKDRDLEIRQREKSLIYDDEPSLSLCTDDFMSGWKGLDEYWNRFEPEICNLNSKSAYSKEKTLTKNIYFKHML